MATAICDRHTAISDQTALFYEHENGETARYSFGEIRRLSNQLAHGLGTLSVERGDRVAIVLPQRVETALAHLAAHKLGAISVPLSILFGPGALEYRLKNSGARVVITDSSRKADIEKLSDRLPHLEKVICCDRETDGNLWDMIASLPGDFDCCNTAADDPAIIIYTSGTTGPPKGALIAHRGLIGNLTGFELSQNLFPQADDVFWTPADWAWTGGLLDGLFPSWYYGVPVVGYEFRKFDAEKACRIMEKYSVTNAFIPPTALKMMRRLGQIRDRFDLSLRGVMSAGEALGEELFNWATDAMGMELNEMWGQSEHNYLVGNCARLQQVKPGSMGKPYPGHRVEIIDARGERLPVGELGEFGAHRDDPVHFLGYWQDPEATRKKYIGDWFRTGDVGYRDEDGYLWFMGRDDDVISSAGYRIGPGEIEDCIMQHPAVLQVAAVGVPDPEQLRGDIVKAFIVLKPEYDQSEVLAREIQLSVKEKLAAYEYPREIEFMDALPMTTTGKVRRIELRERNAGSQPG
ncbi:MAG: AMP-binding protein [Gammaproteobacteria bacterium]|nr:AMP-binding protein [Gammaproteobacteria bacterium]